MTCRPLKIGLGGGRGRGGSLENLPGIKLSECQRSLRVSFHTGRSSDGDSLTMSNLFETRAAPHTKKQTTSQRDAIHPKILLSYLSVEGTNKLERFSTRASVETPRIFSRRCRFQVPHACLCERTTYPPSTLFVHYSHIALYTSIGQRTTREVEPKRHTRFIVPLVGVFIQPHSTFPPLPPPRTGVS